MSNSDDSSDSKFFPVTFIVAGLITLSIGLIILGGREPNSEYIAGLLGTVMALLGFGGIVAGIGLSTVNSTPVIKLFGCGGAIACISGGFFTCSSVFIPVLTNGPMQKPPNDPSEIGATIVGAVTLIGAASTILTGLWILARKAIAIFKEALSGHETKR